MKEQGWVEYMRANRLRSGATSLPSLTPEASYADVLREAGSVTAYQVIQRERRRGVERGGRLVEA